MCEVLMLLLSGSFWVSNYNTISSTITSSKFCIKDNENFEQLLVKVRQLCFPELNIFFQVGSEKGCEQLIPVVNQLLSDILEFISLNIDELMDRGVTTCQIETTSILQN